METIACSLYHVGQDGVRIIREALSLAPNNVRVREVLEKIQTIEGASPLLRLGQRYASRSDEDTGKELLKTLHDVGPRMSSDVAREAIVLVYDSCTSGGPFGNEILSALFRQSSDARRYLTTKLEDATTDVVFETLWNTGDKATHELISIVLDESVWPVESARQRSEQDIFILLIAKLMEAGQDHMSRALGELGRLLASDADRLHPLVDAEGLAVILSSLDTRAPPEIRSQATVIAARYMAASKETGQQRLSDFITSRVSQATVESVVVAFSAAVAMFPLVPATAARLFLTDGFPQSLVPLIVKKSKSTRVRQTALEMLSAAAIDSSCREAINKYCRGWIEDQARTKEEGPSQRTAAVILAKLGSADTTDDALETEEKRADPDEAESLTGKFKKMMMTDDDGCRQSSIEGLAYLSLVPATKEKLAEDEGFLKRLVNTLRNSSDEPGSLFGTISILANLTKYPPNLSEEQKRLLQLKAYANPAKVKLDPDVADQDQAVTKRCAAILRADVVPVLVVLGHRISSTSLALVFSILLSLSREQKHRGAMAQQGAVKFLLHGYTLLSGSSTTSDKRARYTAAHALARILISVDPHLLGGSSASPPIASAISPLVMLLKDDDDNDEDGSANTITSSGQRDLLPRFESLLALTNLASMEDDTIRGLIVRQAWPQIEDLLLSNHHLVQRGAVELVCNVILCPEGIAKFLDVDVDQLTDDAKTTNTTSSSTDKGVGYNRLHVLLALTDVEDIATRRAATGALAMLTESDEDDPSSTMAMMIANAILRNDRAIPILLDLCQDPEDEGIRLRALVCMRNVIFHTSREHASSSSSSSSSTSTSTKRSNITSTINSHGGVDIFKNLLSSSSSITTDDRMSSTVDKISSSINPQILVSVHQILNLLAE